MLSARNLEVVYDDVVLALRGVSIDVPDGKIVALLGSNGAGKNTVVSILATLLKADAGSASVNGFDVATQPADVRQSFSLTGQFAAEDEILTGRENLVLVARLLGYPRSAAHQRAAQLLDAFGLADATDRPVKKFSGGMRRRIDIAASIVVTPELIFLDVLWPDFGPAEFNGALAEFARRERRFGARPA